jgi:organic radical activating enzyme
MKLTNIKTNINSTKLVIGWDPTNVCNFKCQYCHPGANAATDRAPSNLELVVNNFRFMLDEYTKKLGKTKFHFMIAGGEPTLWKDLGKFIVLIKEYHNVYVTIVSNGSRTLRWWEEYGHMVDDAHLTHHLEQGDVEHITKVADILYAKGAKTTVKVLMHPELWDQGIDNISYMKANSKHPWFIQTAKVIGDIVYTESQIKYIDSDLKRLPNFMWFWKNRKLLKSEINLFDSTARTSTNTKLYARPGYYINNNLNNFNGWSCNIGLDRVYIGWAGNLSGTCGVKLFGANEYYNILSDQFKLEFKINSIPAICQSDKCWCKPETHLSKSDLGSRNVSSTRTVIPIALDRNIR